MVRQKGEIHSFKKIPRIRNWEQIQSKKSVLKSKEAFDQIEFYCKSFFLLGTLNLRLFVKDFNYVFIQDRIKR